MSRILKQLRWTIEQASYEFGIDRKTLAKRVKVAGIIPGEDNKFSTANICSAVFTDGEQARAALAVSQKENFDLKNQKLAGTLADCQLFQQVSDDIILILRQKISDAPIPQEVKIQLLKEIQGINVDEVVKANPKTNHPDMEEES